MVCKMQERIYSAAIWYQDFPGQYEINPDNVDRGLVVVGHRHPDIIRTVYNLRGLRTVEFGPNAVGAHEQGFVTNTNRFVGREEAAQIAYAAGQISEPTTQLFSEDLY